MDDESRRWALCPACHRPLEAEREIPITGSNGKPLYKIPLSKVVALGTREKYMTFITSDGEEHLGRVRDRIHKWVAEDPAAWIRISASCAVRRSAVVCCRGIDRHVNVRLRCGLEFPIARRMQGRVRKELGL